MVEKTYCPKCYNYLDSEGICRECRHGEEMTCFTDNKRRFKQITDPDVLLLRPYWRYRHSCAEECEAHHKALDGLILRADDPWWLSHYPWGCKCYVETLSEDDLKRDSLMLGKAPQINYYEWVKPSTKEKYQIPLGMHWPKSYVKGVEIFQQFINASWQKSVNNKPKGQTKKQKNSGCSLIGFVGIIILIALIYFAF